MKTVTYRQMVPLIGELANQSRWYVAGPLPGKKDTRVPYVFNRQPAIAKGWNSLNGAMTFCEAISCSEKLCHSGWPLFDKVICITGGSVNGLTHVTFDIDDHEHKLQPVLFCYQTKTIAQLGNLLIQTITAGRPALVQLTKRRRGFHIDAWIPHKAAQSLPRKFYFEDDFTGREVAIEILNGMPSVFTKTCIQLEQMIKLSECDVGQIIDALDGPRTTWRSSLNPNSQRTLKVRLRSNDIDIGDLWRLEDALNSLSADDYETWIRCGMALRSLNDAGLEIYLRWSKQSRKFKDEAEVIEKWNSFNPTQITYRTIFYLAEQQDWAPTIHPFLLLDPREV